MLYVAGNTVRSAAARDALARLSAGLVGETLECEVVDVLEAPERAEGARVLGTPALVRESPPPQRRVVGDLRDLDRVIDALGLTRSPSHSHGARP